jgi:hypothetical protein
MGLSNFDEYVKAMAPLHRQTEELVRFNERQRKKSERKRKAQGQMSSEELAQTLQRLETESTELLRLNRAKRALRLRRDRALKRRERTAGPPQSK